MDWAAAFYLTALIAAIHVLIKHYDTTSVFEKPLHTAVIGLGATGLTVILLNFYLPDRFITPTIANEESAIPLAEYRKRSGTLGKEDEVLQRERAEKDHSRRKRGHVNFHRLRWKFILGFTSIILRIWFFDYIQVHVECATYPFTVWVPFMVTLYESLVLYCSTHEHLRLRALPANGALKLKSGPKLRSKDVKIVLFVFLLTWSSLSVLRQFAPPRSSYICGGGATRFPSVFLVQFLATVLDVVIIVCASESIFWGGENAGNPPGRATNPVGWLLLIPSACICTVVGLFWYFRPNLRPLITISRPLIEEDLRTFIGCACICIYCTLQLALRYGVRSTAVVCLFLYVAQQALLAARSHPAFLHPISKIFTVFSISTVFVSFIAYLWVAFPTSRTTRMRFSSMIKSPTLLASFAIVMVFTVTVLWSILLPDSFQPQTHPISQLINEATAKHHNFVKDASQSQDLQSAVKQYRKRYERDPPPHFDKWFEFAKNRSSLIIDNFDSIYEDLHPFWSMNPRELRYRTWEAVAYPGNQVSGLMVRNGKVFVGPRIPEQKRWEVEGLGHMMQPFAEYLPDLDFGMNIEDEPRVVVPNEARKFLDTLARSKKDLKLPPMEDGGFSSRRGEQWKKFNAPIQVTRFDMKGIEPTFEMYGSAGCNASTAAHTRVHWNRGVHCESCAQPHKMQQFVREWEARGDPCHQPDLAHLHGLHISPETFKVTRDLMPVFSKAKAPGYLDIRYPSAFAYMDKASYAPTGEFPDPGFMQKEATLFWRGFSSGTSSHSERRAASWKGGHRQRFVHLINYATSPSQGLTLLPTPGSDGFSYRYVNPAILRKYLQTDVGFPGGISKCGGHDCKDEFEHFKPRDFQQTDFQQHWSYKYIMDLDGLGASPNFLAFLQSNSLVFKATIYKEWWEDRVTAWKHFIPVDIRMTEIWSLLAYFAGWPKDKVAKDDGESQWLMQPHNVEGQRIAESGRHWASRALRKEDMEIYLFRLLLEWARLTDDARDSIGYAMEG